MTNNHLHMDLGNMPPIGWAVLVILISMMVGKLANISILFTLGAWGLGIIVVLIIISFVKEFFD
jgi:hypothetical protein